MNDNPVVSDKLPPQEWLDALAEADADLAAGRVVDSATIMRELDELIAEMQTEIADASR